MNGDIIRLLFSKLDPKSAIKCLRVCKYWNACVNQELLNEIKKKYVRTMSVINNFHASKQIYCQECSKGYNYPQGVYHYSLGLCPLLEVEYVTNTNPFVFKKGLKYEADFHKRKICLSSPSSLPVPANYDLRFIVIPICILFGIYLIKKLV